LDGIGFSDLLYTSNVVQLISGIKVKVVFLKSNIFCTFFNRDIENEEFYKKENHHEILNGCAFQGL
jgi:hypothetical protein